MEETADFIQCPYCKYKHAHCSDYLEVGDMAGEFDMPCVACGKSFNVDFYSIFYFTTTKNERGD